MRRLTADAWVGILIIVALVLVVILAATKTTEAQEVRPAPEIFAVEITDCWDMWGHAYQVADSTWIDDCIEYAWWWSKKKPKKHKTIHMEKKINNTLAVWG